MNRNLGNYLTLPQEVWGFLEWITGIIRVNTTHEAYLLNKINKHLPFLEEGLYHELYHVAQVASTGYLYIFVTDIIKVFLPLWKSSLIKEGKGIDLFQKVIAQTPQLSEIIVNKFKEIDQTSSNDLTARSIIESAAYFAQKQYSNPTLTPEDYLKILNHAPGKEYSAAYLYCEQYLKEEAFLHYPLIAFTSLCFSNPPVFFERFCQHLSKTQQNQPLTLKVILAVAQPPEAKPH